MNNSVMDDMDKMEQVCGYLRMIERTRLLRNTTEELERLVGMSGEAVPERLKNAKRMQPLMVLSGYLTIFATRYLQIVGKTSEICKQNKD